MAVKEGGCRGDLHGGVRCRCPRPECRESTPEGDDESAAIDHALAPGPGRTEIAGMAGPPMSRTARGLTRGLLTAVGLLVTACGEREVPPPPVETTPAIVPAVPESTAASDTLEADSLMARDTISLPPS
jgi:hypothetical protein